MSEEEVKEVKLPDEKLLKARLALTELQNLNMQGQLLAQALDKKQEEEKQIRAELFSALPGDAKDWQVNLEKGIATKVDKQVS